MSLLHIRGVQPSKASGGGGGRQRKTPTIAPLSGLLKNVQKITAVTKKNFLARPSFGINNTLDQKSFQFFMDNFRSNQMKAHIPINTQECTNFLSKYGVKFVVERTQELSNSKVFITTHVKKRNMTTFTIQLPADYMAILLFFILLKIDFGGLQIELSPSVGKNFEKFMYKLKASGFKFYYDFIRLNMLQKRFIIVRN